MATHRRINVSSGRSLEATAHYSRAVRVGDTVLQAGTTAIDRKGDVRGVGDVATQVETIMAIAEWSMGKAGGRLDDVVRSRIYVTDMSVADQAARAIAQRFRTARPASTLVEVRGLARPEQLIEIELDAVDGAASTAKRIGSGRAIEDQYAYSRAVRVGDRVFISGSTALTARGTIDGPGDMYRQTRSTLDTIFARARRGRRLARRSRLHEELLLGPHEDGGLHARVAGSVRRHPAHLHDARHPRAPPSRDADRDRGGGDHRCLEDPARRLHAAAAREARAGTRAWSKSATGST